MHLLSEYLRSVTSQVLTMLQMIVSCHCLLLLWPLFYAAALLLLSPPFYDRSYATSIVAEERKVGFLGFKEDVDAIVEIALKSTENIKRCAKKLIFRSLKHRYLLVILT